MSFFDKLMFWKKEPELPDLDEPKLDEPFGDLEEPVGAGLSPRHEPAPDFSSGVPPGPQPGQPMRPFGSPASFPGQMPASPVSAPPGVMPVSSKDLELINAKLDNVKAMLENINHRLSDIEALAKENL